MPHQGDASQIRLEDLRIATKEDKSSVIITFSGDGLDRAAARAVLEDAFPLAQYPGLYVDSDDRGKLTFALPMTSGPDAPTASDILEKIFDATKLDLGLQFTKIAKQIAEGTPEQQFAFAGDNEDTSVTLNPEQGGKFLPEVVIRPEHRDGPPTLRERTVMDVIERKLHIGSFEGAMQWYLPMRSADGMEITIGHAKELCDSEAEAFSIARVMGMLCQQKLGIPAADTRLIAMEGEMPVPHEEGDDYRPPEPISITLSGSTEAIERLQAKLSADPDAEVELTPAGGDQPAQLRIEKKFTSIAEVTAWLGQVHRATGCELPLQLQNALLTDTPDEEEAKAGKKVTHQPAVLLWFDEPDIAYNNLMIQSMTKYVSNYMQGKGEIQLPEIPGDDGQTMLDLTRPVALIAEKTYKDKDVADAAAKEMTARIKSLLQASLPATGRKL